LECELQEEKENYSTIFKDLEKKKVEFLNFNRSLDRMKEIYENKISLLNTKINSDEDSLNELKQEIKNKNEVIQLLLFIINILTIKS